MRKSLLPLLLFVAAGLGAGDWQELAIRLEESVWSSSTYCEQIRGQQVCYPPAALFDGDPATCWVEAAPGDGVGEWVLVLVNGPVAALELVNGFARSPALHANNGRVKVLKVSFAVDFGISDEEHAELVGQALRRFAEDHRPFLREIEKHLGVDLDLDVEALRQYEQDIFAEFGMSCLRLEILSVYPGAKYQDTCLSEVSVRRE